MEPGLSWRQRLFSGCLLAMLLVSTFTWAPAAWADEGTPEDITTVVVTPPEELLTEESEAPVVEPASLLQEEESLPGDVSVSSISLQCLTVAAEFSGTVTVSDPSSPASVDLIVRTTDNPAIATLQTISVAVGHGQTSYPFTVVLEPGDFEASTTDRIVVTGPDGTPVSTEVGLGVVNGATVCQPEGTTDPSPTVTETSTTTETVTATATETSTATGTATVTPTATVPTVTIGTVANTSGSNLNCRAQANATASILAKLAPGTTVDVRGAASNGWVPVKCAGKDGFVSASFLQISTVAVTPTATATVTATSTPGSGTVATVANTGGASLRCRTAANTTATIITELAPATQLETRGPAANGWVPVKCGGRDGFVSAAYVVLGGGTPITPTATVTATTTPVGTPTSGSAAYVAGTGGSGLRCRTAPVSGAQITVIPENTRVTIEAQSNGWGRIQCGGQTGWVSLTYILFVANPAPGSAALRIDVNLSSQYMIVYQGDQVLGRTYVSTGRRGFDTPTGTFLINRKVKVKDMTGVLGGEYYNVRNVPNVMYFTYVGHAIHGAYWHNNFGYVMSHGCVNLPLGFAEWLYSITPIGTKVTIHY